MPQNSSSASAAPLHAHHTAAGIWRVGHGSESLFDYHYRPDSPAAHCARPYLHPLRTLAGDILTDHQPADHPWHQGLSLTLCSVNGVNFWGGPTYRAATGKYAQENNVGTQRHRAWLTDEPISGGWLGRHALDWLSATGQPMFSEVRTLTVHDLDPAIGQWRLDWESVLTNVLGEPIVHQSYCSGEGLAGSGYTGLFLRMNHDFGRPPAGRTDGSSGPGWQECHDGERLIPSPEQVNGWPGPRLAYQGHFAASGRDCLVLAEDLTENPDYRLHWFFRPQYPALAWSTAFYCPQVIPAGGSLRLHHRLSLIAGHWTMERAADRWSTT